MLKPVEMQMMRLIGMRSDMPAIIRNLHELGAVQFSRPRDERLAAEKPLESYPLIAEQLIRMRGIAESLTPQKFERPEKEFPPEKLLEECSKITIDKRIAKIAERLEEIGGEESDLGEAARVLEGLKGLRMDLSLLESRNLCFFIGRIPNDKLAKVEAGIRPITERYTLRSSPIGRHESVLLLAADAKSGGQVSEMLQKLGFIETRLPKLGAAGGPEKLLIAVKERLEALKAERAVLDAELGEISLANYSKIMGLCEMLEAAEARAQAPENFGRTAQTFVMEAWVPKPGLAKVSEALGKEFGKRLLIEKVESEEEAPTLLNNPKPLGPFQFMIEFISLPKSHELDPTMIFALTFPIIYGMMLGDAGYGVASLLIALLLIRKFKGTMLEPIGKVWAYASVPTVIFGIIYDEYFGFAHEHLLGAAFYHGMHRMESMTTLLLASILLGAVHLGFGFLLGAINKFREGHAPHGFAKLGWLAVEISGIILVSTVMFKVFPDLVIAPFAVLFLLGAAVLVKVEGPIGLIEIPSLAGNILSYARILAVGLASVVVAELINELLLPRPEQGLLMLVFAPIYLGLHLFNIILGMFESLVQGARLNYVEFFSKFYEGGGRAFSPFMHTRRFTT